MASIAGFVFGPVIGFMLSAIEIPEFYGVKINTLTSPGYLQVFTTLTMLG
jgi:hypothetical protein